MYNTVPHACREYDILKVISSLYSCVLTSFAFYAFLAHVKMYPVVTCVFRLNDPGFPQVASVTACSLIHFGCKK